VGTARFPAAARRPNAAGNAPPRRSSAGAALSPRTERQIGIRRRHGIGGSAAKIFRHSRLSSGLARHDRVLVGFLPLRVSAFRDIQAQTRLAAGFVRSVTFEAAVGKDGPDIAIELERFRRRECFHWVINGVPNDQPYFERGRRSNPLPTCTQYPNSCADHLGGLRATVRVFFNVNLSQFQFADVAVLYFPHGPFRCPRKKAKLKPAFAFACRESVWRQF
jgi:hypothetical protein